MRETGTTSLDSLALPGYEPFYLFGDTINDGLSRILDQLVGPSLDVLDAVVERADPNRFVRWQTMYVCLYRVCLSTSRPFSANDSRSSH